MNNPPHNPETIRQSLALDELPIFFIVGRGRSGSTLLRSLFDAHPQVMIPLESRFVQFLYYKFPLRNNWTTDTALQSIQNLAHSFEPPKLQWDTLKNQIEFQTSGLSFDNVCKLIYLNTQTEFPKEEIQIIGDKNPRYTFFIPQLLKIFPKAKFIHLVRDYRDNITSIQRVGSHINESGNPYFSLGRWMLYNRFIAKYQKKFPDKFYTLRFEDLINESEREMKSLCKFLTLDFRHEILNYQEGIHRYFEDDGFNTLHKSLKTPFDASKIGEWKSVLPQRQAIRCEILAGKFPTKYGYLPAFQVNLIRKTGIKLLFYPIYWMGQVRFILKKLFYKSRLIMRIVYHILLRNK